ncbi:class I SAM-dependent methyltransferase [Actibacterium sp. XHP0104]|uniref:class I SAM-dependent methyltransferase n=1 Tax=Actibacterium sp. XHP0104 TaxID=2984335 RepID=UPI0021E7C835|nr:class I SAM-dependent methyltransferase [Actibacterium sp. XHP0104]MCV2882808.1 class I SAM-dependent methyltransferase [Actibacterium sp. XHP0104]
MSHSRLTLALETGAAVLPDDGLIAVIGPDAGADLSALPRDRVQIIQGFRPDHDAWAGRGYQVVTDLGDDYAAAVVFVPRAKAQARLWLARALAATKGGLVIVDGQKTDGIDSLFKDCRKRAACSPALSKSHGKLFSLTGDAADLADWAAPDHQAPEGFETQPGVFSADAVDRGSALLAQALPAKIKGRVADLGAGWGYLSAQVLDRAAITELHLIEADHAALDCARRNVTDPRTQFHWADVTKFKPGVKFDVILCNPPFHTSRAADPALGVAFLAAGARMLTPGGEMWIVANRHLPYERSLATLFRDVAEMGGDTGFKIIRAAHPLGVSRPRR